MQVTQCTGEGQGSCKRCSDKGKWNRNWCAFYTRLRAMRVVIALIV